MEELFKQINSGDKTKDDDIQNAWEKITLN
jgi:hypothetical protein